MSSRTQLGKTILSEGLQDLIPLPEIAETVRVQRLVAPESVIPAVSSALIALLEEGLIQVRAGHWEEEPDVLDSAAARELLVDEGHYEWNSAADLVRRVYYVNVQNIRNNEADT